MSENEAPGTQQLHTTGTGAYEGAIWDGKRWVRDGEVVKVGPWQRTSWGWKSLFVALAAGVGVYTLGLFQGWWG